MREMYLEDFAAGDRFRSQGATLTESAIVDFAMMWDPQLFHIDLPAAAEHEVGGLLASGMHTMCLTLRLFLQTGVLENCNITGGGMDDLRWLLPVRPGDTLRVEVEVIEARPSRTKPDRGILVTRYHTFNQRDDEVLTFVCTNIVRCRPEAG